MDAVVILFIGISENERFARMCAAAFAAQLDPTLEQIADIKTAVSEAVTNAIIHGYEQKEGKVKVWCKLKGDIVYIQIEDNGVGIADIEKAKQALYTTRPEWERSGMGFTFMETFMDNLKVESIVGEGTVIRMDKEIGIEKMKMEA